MVASWMVDGEALVMMAVMISSNSPSRQGARTKTSDPDFRFRDCGGGAEFFLVISDYFRSFLVIRSLFPEGGVRGPHGVATPPRLIIVVTKIIPISIVVEIVFSNEVHINMLLLSHQRGQGNIIWINMSLTTSKHRHNGINLII